MKPRYEKRSHWKPTRRDWVLAAVLIPTGVVGLLISWWSEQLQLQGLAATALAVGIGYGVGTALRLNIYRNLSPEEQRKADRAQHDERNLLIEAKAMAATAVDALAYPALFDENDSRLYDHPHDLHRYVPQEIAEEIDGFLMKYL